MPTRIFLIGQDNLFLHAFERLICENDLLEHVGTAAAGSDGCYEMLRAATPDLVVLTETQKGMIDQLCPAVPHARFVLIRCSCHGTMNPAGGANITLLWPVVGYIPWDVARSEIATLLRFLAAGHTILPRAPHQRNFQERAAVLTPRQRDVLQLASAGHSNKGIAKILGVSVFTVKAHMSAILASLDVPNRAAAAALWKAQSD